MTTKFGIGIVFRKAQVSAKYNCPTSTVTLFSEYGGTRIHSFPVIQSQKMPANSGGTIVYNYPCHVRRRGWMPTGLLLYVKTPKRKPNIIDGFIELFVLKVKTVYFPIHDWHWLPIFLPTSV